ncbi:hypothetical protein B0H14DRAFT_2593882 [Mycena olivaceomarginata]|nr:hypothetical protein B0H14DRAFT_2593882 [Mycena olivaceomarginata]
MYGRATAGPERVLTGPVLFDPTSSMTWQLLLFAASALCIRDEWRTMNGRQRQFRPTNNPKTVRLYTAEKDACHWNIGSDLFHRDYVVELQCVLYLQRSLHAVGSVKSRPSSGGRISFDPLGCRTGSFPPILWHVPTAMPY